MIWVPREPPLENLTEIDSDVEPIDTRGRDLGIPDGFWWAISSVIAVAGLVPVFALIGPLAGEQPAAFVAAAWLVAAGVFAKERWGHRRYRLQRAFRDAGKILGTGVALAVLWAVVSAIAPSVVARLP